MIKTDETGRVIQKCIHKYV